MYPRFKNRGIIAPPHPLFSLKDPEGRLLEATPEEMWQRLVQGVTRVEKGATQEFSWLFSDFRFVPGGRILFGLGNWRRSTLFNCYYIPIREDSVKGITRFLDEAARTFAYGGGVGSNADALRPKGAKVGNAGMESSGAVSFMELFSTLAGVMGASGGRRGALMLTFSDTHPDLLDFLQVKTDPERSRVRHANISLRATDAFLQAALADKPWALSFTTPREHQVFLAEHPLLKRYRRERGGEVPDWPTAHTVDPFQRVHLQATLQRHVDQSISSTVNLPRETPKEVVENLFLTAWKEGCKGITVFREGSREEVIEPLPPVGVYTFCRTA
ncbi:hypothetical protein [Thermus scotoductus]|nr:hypothetical protein [Thermus scotoductus]